MKHLALVNIVSIVPSGSQYNSSPVLDSHTPLSPVRKCLILFHRNDPQEMEEINQLRVAQIGANRSRRLSGGCSGSGVTSCYMLHVSRVTLQCQSSQKYDSKQVHFSVTVAF